MYGATEPVAADTGTSTPGMLLPSLNSRVQELEVQVQQDAAEACNMNDAPSLMMPWFLFAVAMVPLALLEEQLLGYVAVATCAALSFGFLLFSRGRAWMVLAGMCFALTALGAVLGRYDHNKYLAELSIYERSPSFHDVLPGIDPGAVKDAAFLEFSKSTYVDTSRGLGYQDGSRWCVAPIVDGPQDVIGFWAVGKDCCRSRGFFACGDVHNTSLHSGVVVLDTQQRASPDIRFYEAAVQMAAETYDLGLPAEPIFVIWGTTSKEALQNKLGSAVTFVVFALFVALLAVPTFVVVLSLGNLWLAKSEPDTAKQMIFGFELTPQNYSQQLQRDLLNHRSYWSGEVIHDYAFHLANKHLFLGPLLCHPAHPFSKWERTVVLAIICPLVIFPVAAFSEQFGETGMVRTILVAVFATMPRNLLKLYLIDVSQEDAELELEEQTDAGAKLKIRQAQTYEFVFLTVASVLTIGICIGCTAFIRGHTSEPLSTVLGRNCDGLGFSFVLEMTFDMLIPYFGEAEYAHQATMGFFGRWCWERDDYRAGKASMQARSVRPKPEAISMRRMPLSQGSAGALLGRQRPASR